VVRPPLPKWRTDGTQVSVKSTLVERNRLISEPQDIARPSSCIVIDLLWLVSGVFVQESSNHFLILGIILFRFIFKKIYTGSA